jgi:hypothetical protein
VKLARLTWRAGRLSGELHEQERDRDKNAAKPSSDYVEDAARLSCHDDTRSVANDWRSAANALI